MAWDVLRATHSEKVADKVYVLILEIAARESQDALADALRHLRAIAKFDLHANYFLLRPNHVDSLQLR